MRLIRGLRLGFSLSASAKISWPASCSDPDDNLDICYLTEGVGIFAAGQTVRTWRGQSEAGYVRVDWDASTFASGVYFYRLRAANFAQAKKMVLLK